MARKEKKVRFSTENLGMQSDVLTNIITDMETGVQYLLAVYPNVGSGLTVLIDRDGKPLINKGL